MMTWTFSWMDQTQHRSRLTARCAYIRLKHWILQDLAGIRKNQEIFTVALDYYVLLCACRMTSLRSCSMLTKTLGSREAAHSRQQNPRTCMCGQARTLLGLSPARQQAQPRYE